MLNNNTVCINSSLTPDAEYIVQGFALPALCFVGALANVINIIVLADRRLVAPTYIYLFYLALADLITLLLYFTDLISKMHYPNELWSQIYTAYVYLPLGSVSTSSSLLLTVAVTIDRYVFIQNPTAITSHAAPIKIQLVEPRCKARKIGVVVCLLAAFINIPRMTAWYVDFEVGCRRARAWTEDSDGWFSIYSYLRLLFLNIGSILALATFNTLLIVLVHRSTARREVRRSYGTYDGKTDKKNYKSRVFSKSNVSLTITLIAATLLALAGEIPSTLFSRISARVIWKSDPHIFKEEPYNYFFQIAYMLILIEYSGNFVIYCLLNKRFRIVLRFKLGIPDPDHHQVYFQRRSHLSKDRKSLKDRRRKSLSLDELKNLANGMNGNVIFLDDKTENMVTDDGLKDEHLEEFWRPFPGAQVRTSRSYPEMGLVPGDNGTAETELEYLTPKFTEKI